MGKGDMKSAKGKRFAGSYGNRRKKGKRKHSPIMPTATKAKSETTEVEAPKAAKKPAAKKPAAKKPAAKKATAKKED